MLLFLSIIGLGVLFGLLFFLMFWQWSLLVTRAPFVPVPRVVLPEIVKVCQLKPEDRMYDLGCGDARVLVACYQAQPLARYVGIDKALAPILFAKWRLRRLPSKHTIQLWRQNFFKADLSSATVIFTYLFPGLMDDLLPKLEHELTSGARLISCDFVFKTKAPVQIIKLTRSPYSLARTLYIYEF